MPSEALHDVLHTHYGTAGQRLARALPAHLIWQLLSATPIRPQLPERSALILPPDASGGFLLPSRVFPHDDHSVLDRRKGWWMMTPQIIVCDGDKDLASLLLTALTSVQGHPCEVFVKFNGTEQIVILLPTPGPSLAAALRDWVYSWWSDGDAATYGTPESYCATFGVIIPTGEESSPA